MVDDFSTHGKHKYECIKLQTYLYFILTLENHKELLEDFLKDFEIVRILRLSMRLGRTDT